jgi:hypothetical protein
MEGRSAYRQYRCEATMPDGTTAVLFASTDSPAKALAMVRETWLADGLRPATIRVYPGNWRAIGLFRMRQAGV